jgi:hypothetical protein
VTSYDERSRYAKVPTYQVVDHRGRVVSVVSVPPPPDQAIAGTHRLRQGQRLDHLAATYLANPMGFWCIAEANNALQAEWLTEQREIDIPQKGT